MFIGCCLKFLGGRNEDAINFVLGDNHPGDETSLDICFCEIFSLDFFYFDIYLTSEVDSGEKMYLL